MPIPSLLKIRWCDREWSGWSRKTLKGDIEVDLWITRCYIKHSRFFSISSLMAVYSLGYFKTQIRITAITFLNCYSTAFYLYLLREQKRRWEEREKSYRRYSSSWLTQPCCSMARTIDDSLSSFSRLVGRLANSWLSS